MMRILALLACVAALLAQRPPVEEAWDLLAKGARNDAIRVLNRILTTNPEDADARLLLGSILTEDGKYSEAITQLSEAARLRPRSAEAHNALGDALSGSGDSKAARPEFEKTIDLDPKFAPARVSLALILVEAGEFAAAAKHVDRALEVLGNTEDAAFPLYLRAKAYTDAGDVEKAAGALKKAVTLRPDFAEAWSDLGQARKMMSDDAGALTAFQHAVESDPEIAVSQYRLGSEYLDQGKVQPAVKHLEAAFRLDPENQSTLYNLQLALRQDGQLERARQIRDKLAELIRARDQAHQNAMTAVRLNNEGAALEKSGNLPGALEKYRAALALDAEHVGIRTNFAAALLRLGQWAQGIAELREALRRDPGNQSLKQALTYALSQAPAGTVR